MLVAVPSRPCKVSSCTRTGARGHGARQEPWSQNAPQHEASSVHTAASGPRPAQVEPHVNGSAGTPGDAGGAVHTSPRGHSSLDEQLCVPVSLVAEVPSVVSVAPPVVSVVASVVSLAVDSVDGPFSLS